MKFRKPLVGIVTAVTVVAILVGCCEGYLCDYYPADREAIAAFANENPVSRQVLGEMHLHLFQRKLPQD